VTRLPVDLRPHDDREMLLLIDCARASVEPERATRIRECVTAGLNWDRLLTLARRNGLAPLLYWHLSQICAASVPAAELACLRDYFQKNSAFGLLLTGELIRLLKVLHDNGIEAIPYKGPAMAVSLYGSVARRQFCDLDILVRRADVWEASRVIEAQGFEPLFPIPEKMRARFARQAYVRLFRRDAGRTVVELHWGITESYWAVQFDADAVWQRLEPMSLQGVTVFTPCPEDLLLMLCVHLGRHGSDKLEGIGSIAELLRRTQDCNWERIWQRSREMHCRRMLEFGLLLAHGLLDVPLPPQAAAVSRSRSLLAMARRAVRNLSADDSQSRGWSWRAAFHLRLNDSRTDQVRHCVRLLMSTPEDWVTSTLPGSLSFASPLVRAVRLVRRYGLQ
jgi:hypothetical protein